MSAKIYHGFIAENMTMDEMMQAIPASFSNELLEIGHQVLSQAFTESYLTGLDLQGLSHDESLELARNELREGEDEMRKGYRSDFDVRVEFGAKQLGPNVLILDYTENAALSKKLRELPFMQPYFYFDNTDKPGDISDQDWDRRRERWEQALGYQSPENAGFITVLLVDNEDFTEPALDSGMMQAEPRAKRIAQDAIGKIIVEKSTAKTKSSNNSTGPFMREWMRFERGEAYQEEYRLAYEKALARLQAATSRPLKM